MGEDTFEDTRESGSREPKLLFSSGFAQSQIGDIIQRLDSVEYGLGGVPRGGVAGGYETFNDAKTNFTKVFSNITNIYEKIQINRKTVQTKCSRQRCDMILGKVKKVKTQVEFLQNTNKTLLEDSKMVMQISTLTSQVNSLIDNQMAQQVQINSLKTKVTSLESKVTSLENTTTTNTEDIDKIGNNQAYCKETNVFVSFGTLNLQLVGEIFLTFLSFRELLWRHQFL